MTARIGICLATCNGARFLPAQLDSIAAQTYGDWHLYVRDDHSTDATQDILDCFARRHPGRVTRFRDLDGRLGASANFDRILGQVDTPYVAFSDQDDVWHRDKLGRSLAQMSRLEDEHGAETPVMVHADRRVIDVDGREITASYWRSRGLSPARFGGLETYYSFCLAAGSTMLINRALVDLALPVPAAARMYDCWIELIAHAFGVVGWSENIVLDHRRHGANASGSAADNNSAAARRPLARAWRLFGNLNSQRMVYARYFLQATAFRARYQMQLRPGMARRLDMFLSVPERSLMGRLLALYRSRGAPPGVARFLVCAALSAGVLSAALPPRTSITTTPSSKGRTPA